MTLQKTVNDKQAFGIVGEFYDDTPRRVDTYNLLTEGTVGYAFTLGTGGVSQGGSGAFAGILINPKTQALRGDLTPSLKVPANSVVELCKFGRVNVTAITAVAVNNAAFFVTATGELKAAAAGSTVSGAVEIKNSKFLEAGAANEVVVLELTN